MDLLHMDVRCKHLPSAVWPSFRILLQKMFATGELHLIAQQIATVMMASSIA